MVFIGNPPCPFIIPLRQILADGALWSSGRVTRPPVEPARRRFASRVSCARWHAFSTKIRRADPLTNSGERLRLLCLKISGPDAVLRPHAAALGWHTNRRCEKRSRLGMVRGNHRIVPCEAPFFPILIGRKVAFGLKVSLQGLRLETIFQADQKIRGD